MLPVRSKKIMNKRKFFGKFSKVVSFLILLSACILLIRDIANVRTYSTYIDKDVSALTSELHNRYANLFYTSEVYEKDQMELHFVALGGSYGAGELHIAEPAEITYQTKSKLGTLRVLLADKADGKAVYDAIVTGKDGKFSLAPGEYEVYVVGSWFWGSIIMQYPADARIAD